MVPTCMAVFSCFVCLSTHVDINYMELTSQRKFIQHLIFVCVKAACSTLFHVITLNAVWCVVHRVVVVAVCAWFKCWEPFWLVWGIVVLRFHTTLSRFFVTWGQHGYMAVSFMCSNMGWRGNWLKLGLMQGNIVIHMVALHKPVNGQGIFAYGHCVMTTA